MAAINRTAYPYLPTALNLTEQELTQFYTPTSPELELAHRNALGIRPILSFLVLLKTFQRLGYFPQLREVPQPIWQHLKKGLALTQESEATPLHPKRNNSLYRYHNAIRTYLNIKVFDETATALITKTVTEAAQTKSNPADLINVALEILIKERYELPAFSTLDRLVQNIRTTVNNQFCEKVLAGLFLEQRQQLDAMLATRPDQTQSDWVRLREVPKSASLTHLQELHERYTWLVGLLDVQKFLIVAGVPPAKIQDFAAQAKPLQPGELQLYAPARRYTLMLCQIQQARLQTRDNLIETFLKRMAFFHSRAKEELAAIRERQQATTEKLLGVLTEILLTSNTAATLEDPAAFGTLVRQTLAGQGGREALLADCEAIAAYNGNNHLSLVYRYYKSHRATLFQLVRSLKFVATTQDQSVKAALSVLLQHEDSTQDYLSVTLLDLSFASEQWQRLVRVKHQGEYQLVRRQLEICIFSALADELKNGDMAVSDSGTFADYRQQLLPWSECVKHLPQFCAGSGLPTTASEFVSQLKEKLVQVADRVDAAYPDNGQFEITKSGELIVRKKTAKKNSSNLKILEQTLREQMPPRSVLDILCNVQHYTNFTRHFGPPSGSDPKIDNPTERYILTTFCYGCNLGPSQLVRHLPSDKVKDKHLSYANFRHIDEARLNAARTDIVNAYSHFELPRFWGDGSKVGADGTKYELAQQNLVSEYHIRYGGYGGIMYHFVSDTYVALFSRFITCGVWEGVYILDLFSKNTSQIQPEVVHSDTQGQNLPIFGLAYLLGIQLMPRIRNIKDLTFHRPTKKTRYQHIDALFGDEIDWDLIERHWQDLMRVVISIKTGLILPSTILRRLTNYSRKNKLYQALRELGRAVRTIYLLQFISDGNLRIQVSAMTNKVESYNNFSGWFYFGGEGQIWENDPVEQDKRTQYLDLVADAAIYQNTIDMSRILKKLAKNGLQFEADDVAALSPYLTRHIKRFGDYMFDLSKVPDPWDGRLELPITPPESVKTVG